MVQAGPTPVRRRHRLGHLAVYSVASHVRTPEQMLAVLARDEEAEQKSPPRPRPQHKRVWASLEQEPREVLQEAFREALQRDPQGNQRWVAVVDGNKTQLTILKQLAEHYGVQLTIVLDIFHVLEYLWKAGHALAAEGSAELEQWDLHPQVQLPVSDPQLLIQRHPRLSATAGVVVGALHRDRPIQPVHRLGAIPLEPKHHLATLHPPSVVAGARLLRHVLHYLSSHLHHALVHDQFQPQHPSGTAGNVGVGAVAQLHLDKLNDVSDQFLIHVDLPVVAIVLLTGRSFYPCPKGVAPAGSREVDRSALTGHGRRRILIGAGAFAGIDRGLPRRGGHAPDAFNEARLARVTAQPPPGVPARCPPRRHA